MTIESLNRLLELRKAARERGISNEAIERHLTSMEWEKFKLADICSLMIPEWVLARMEANRAAAQ